MNDEIAALAYIKRLAQFSTLERRETDRIVQERFDQVLDHASANCDFYRSMTRPFPVLTKECVRENIHSGLISNQHLGHPCLVVEKTSGSTQEAVPFAYLRGFERYARMVFPFMFNTNWRWGDKYCLFSTLHCSRDRCSTENLPSFVNQIKIPTSENIFQDIEAQKNAAEILRTHQDSVVHCDPYYLCAVAVYCYQHKIKLSFKGISSTYELLTPNVKRYLEKVFQCQVFDSYGCSEFGPIAFACQHGAKHIFEGSVFVEIIEKGLYMDPDVGEIVVTALDNPAMPLIRYRTGDVGKIIQGPCVCARTAKMIEVYGRKRQCVPFKGFLFSERDIAGFMDMPGVLLYQFHESREHLSLDIVLKREYRSAEYQKRTEIEVNRRFGKFGVAFISINFVSHIRPEESGKFNSVDRVR